MEFNSGFKGLIVVGIGLRVAVTKGVEGRTGVEAVNFGISFSYRSSILCRNCEQLQHINSMEHCLP